MNYYHHVLALGGKNCIMLIHSVAFTASMALGEEVLGEARGKVAGLRALGQGKIEVSLQDKGMLLGGSEMEDVTTNLLVSNETKWYSIWSREFNSYVY
jgi:hypothetical protein